MKKLVAILLIFLLLMIAESAFSAKNIRIGYLRIVNSLPTFVAVEKGLFEQEGGESRTCPI